MYHLRQALLAMRANLTATFSTLTTMTITLLVLGAVDLWWLLTRRALVVSEIAGVGVLAAASALQIVLVSLDAASVPGAYPNSGPYWAVISVCALAFLALPPRRA